LRLGSSSDLPSRKRHFRFCNIGRSGAAEKAEVW